MCLVFLDGDHAFGGAHDLHRDGHALDHVIGALDHCALVDGEAGFALCPVGDDAGYGFGRRQLDVGRESGSTHAHNSRRPHPCQGFFLGAGKSVQGWKEVDQIFGSRDGFTFSRRRKCLDDDAGALAVVGLHSGLDLPDDSGY